MRLPAQWVLHHKRGALVRCPWKSDLLKLQVVSGETGVDYRTLNYDRIGRRRDMATEIHDRREIVEESIHSIEMESGSITPWMREQVREWVEGRTDIPTLVKRTRSHYGLES